MKQRLLSLPLILFSAIYTLGFTGCTSSSGEEDIPFEELSYEPLIVRSDLHMAEAAAAYRKDTAADPAAVYKTTLAGDQPFLTAWLLPDARPEDSLVVGDSALPEIIHYFFGDSSTWKLLDSIRLRFPPEKDLRNLLQKPLQRFAYYFPDEPRRAAYTYVSGYEQTGAGTIDQVFINDEYIGIGLHYFMGQDFSWYPPDVPVYMRRRFSEEYIAPVVMEQLTAGLMPSLILDKQPVLLDMMILEGIKTEIRHKLMPDIPDSVLLNYTAPQMEWVNYYEGRIYKELLPDLYSTDVLVQRRYINESPFTNTLSRDSAPRLGQFIGWKIVRAYIRKHPETMPADLIAVKDFIQLYQEAGYRPPREPEAEKKD